MFLVLSGHLIIVPIISLWPFACTKYSLLVCVYVCVLIFQGLLRCFHVAGGLQSIVLAGLQGPTHTSLLALIPLFMKSQLWPWTSEIMRVCVGRQVTVEWRQAIVELALTTEHWNRKQLTLHQRPCVLCVNFCRCEKSPLFVFCNSCFPHISNVKMSLLAWEAN